MDDRRFDSLVKALAEGRSRRSVLKGLLGLGGAALVGGTLADGGADAARRPAPTPTPVKCPGQQTPGLNGQCDCVVPKAAGTEKCGPACCNRTGVGPGHSECCDNACCFGTCYGEELCCPTNARAGGLLPTHRICDGVCLDLRIEGACCDDGDCDDPCQVCDIERRTCVARCDAGTEVCCTEQAGAGECVTGTCCPGAPCGGEGLRCCGSESGATACIPAECCNDEDCTDIDACTRSTCEVGYCVQSPINCNDFNACTIDSCDPVRGCIHTVVSCDDGNACTEDSCDPGRGCIFEPIDCNDHNACTIDSCDRDLGCIHVPVDCDDFNACTEDSCDTVEGCIHRDIDCEDGNPCTDCRCDFETGCICEPNGTCD